MSTMVKDKEGNPVPVTNNNTSQYADDADNYENEVVKSSVKPAVSNTSTLTQDSDEFNKKIINNIVNTYIRCESNAENWKKRNYYADTMGNVLGRLDYKYADIAIMKEFADTLSKKCAELMKFRKGVFASEYEEYQKHVKERNEKFTNEREAAKIKREDESITKKANKAAEKIKKEKEHEQRIKQAEKEAEEKARELYKI